jgi:hypothetical protein
MAHQHTHLEIACQQVMTEDASVFSVQWADFPSELAADFSPTTAMTRYLAYIRRNTLSLIRPTTLESGVEFRLANTRLSLLSFLPAELTAQSATLRICGGVLVQPRQCDRGELRFGVEDHGDRVRISLQLSDFCPLLLGNNSPSLLRFWLYRLTQATIHRLVTVRFLALLFREQGGRHAGIRVKNVVVHAGRPV